MTRKLIPVSALTVVALISLACQMTVGEATFEYQPVSEARGTAEAVARTLSTIEAEIQPTIAAAYTSTPEIAATAIAMATRTASTIEAVLTAIPPDPLYPAIGDNASLALPHYEAMVLGTIPEPSFVSHIPFPKFVQTEVEAALIWTNEWYTSNYVNGQGDLWLVLRPDSYTFSDDINRSSLGAFVFQVEEPFPTDTEGALELIYDIYPGLTVELIPQANELDTFNFESKTMLPFVVRGQPTLVPQFIHTGVTHKVEQNQVLVWIVVARGSLVGVMDKLP